MKLILPFSRNIVFASYKTPAYKNYWGYDHYGVDLANRWIGGNGTVFASGNGEVVACGQDSRLGVGIAILYRNCENRVTGEVTDLIVRYIHCDKAYVKVGDFVTEDTPIAHESNQGTNDPHLHMECDTDTKYPVHTPQVKATCTFWRKGIDTTLDMADYLWQAPDRVLVPPAESDLIADKDTEIDMIPDDLYKDTIRKIQAILQEL